MGEPSRTAKPCCDGRPSGAAALLAGAIGYALGACVQVAPEEMTLPTPSADCDLEALLAHLAASMLGPCLPVYALISDGQAAVHHLAPGRLVLTISLSLLCLKPGLVLPRPCSADQGVRMGTGVRLTGQNIGAEK
jgi:hypothetical protein